jgi:hypothetical protein
MNDTSLAVNYETTSAKQAPYSYNINLPVLKVLSNEN